MKKKVLAVLLAGMMVLSMAACGDDTGNSSDPGNNTTPGNSQENTSQSSGSGDEGTDAQGGSEATGHHAPYEAKDMGGRTIKIGLWWDIYYDSEYQTLEDIKAAGGSYDNAEAAQMQLDAVRAVEEKWNVKIDYVNLGWEGITSSISTSVTNGTPDCDIYLTDLQFGIAPVINGYAQKLSEIAPADSDILNDQTVFTTFPVLGNDDYLFYLSSTIPTGALYLAYNESMLDELGLEAPEKLAERGEWTWEKFADYCSQLTRDTDGDGNTDVYGYGDVWTMTVQGLLASNNTMIAGSYTEGLSDPKTVEVFNFLDRLYNVDGSARPYSDDWNDQLNALFQNKVAFAFIQYYQLTEHSDIDFNVRICPAPQGPNGDGSMTPIQITNCYFIPVGVEDATAVYEIFEELTNWYDYDTFYRDDPAWFESGFADEEQLELGYTEGYKSNSDMMNYVSGAPVGDVFYAICVNKDMSVSQAIESYKQQMQDALDAMTANLQ